MALKITITDAGRAALINANKSGTRSVSIISVGVSATAITADKSATSLADEIKRITAISGEVTAADAIHLTAKDDGDSIYTVRSFALYLDDGTLFAIYGQSSPILEKSAAAMLLLQLDIRFADIDATQIQFGNLDFINPAATEKTAGITRLTTLGEAEQSTENIAVSPAELRRYAEKLARQADMIAALATKFDKAGGVINGTTSINDGILQLNKSRSGLWNTLSFATGGAMRWCVVSDVSAETGNNVGSDFHITRVLDNGQQIFALNISRATGLVDVPASFQVGGVRPYSPHNDGAGSGLDADFWRGLSPEHFATADDRNNLQNAVNNLTATKVDKVQTFSASDTQVDILYANRRFSFQVDGNIVNYGTDAAVLTTLRDGNLWTRGSVSSQNNVNATGMLHIQSFNGLNGFDIHCDEDGNARMYGKNGNTGYQLFLAYNPQGNLDFLSPSGQAFINSHEICHRGNDGAGSGWDMDFFRGNAPEHFATADDRNNLQNAVNNLTATKVDKVKTFSASDTQVDILYANRRFSFQVDGNIVNYGTDAAVLTTLKDGNLWTRGALSSQNNVNATGMLHIQSFNGLNGFDIHCDEDGSSRMYGKNGNTGYQLLLAYNPQGNLDFLSPSGQAFINGQLIWNKNNDGAGSGLDADLLDGLDSSYFAPNSRIQTWGVPNGLMKRIDDHVELHLKLDNVVGVISLPHTFNNIVDIQITTFRDTNSRPVWANVISYTNNTITVSGNYMAHGNNQNADSCAGFIHVYGN